MDLGKINTPEEKAIFQQLLKFGELAKKLSDAALIGEVLEHCVFDSPTYAEALLEEVLIRFAEKAGLINVEEEIKAILSKVAAIQ